MLSRRKGSIVLLTLILLGTSHAANPRFTVVQPTGGWITRLLRKDVCPFPLTLCGNNKTWYVSVAPVSITDIYVDGYKCIAEGRIKCVSIYKLYPKKVLEIGRKEGTSLVDAIFEQQENSIECEWSYKTCRSEASEWAVAQTVPASAEAAIVHFLIVYGYPELSVAGLIFAPTPVDLPFRAEFDLQERQVWLNLFGTYVPLWNNTVLGDYAGINIVNYEINSQEGVAVLGISFEDRARINLCSRYSCTNISNIVFGWVLNDSYFAVENGPYCICYGENCTSGICESVFTKALGGRYTDVRCTKNGWIGKFVGLKISGVDLFNGKDVSVSVDYPTMVSVPVQHIIIAWDENKNRWRILNNVTIDCGADASICRTPFILRYTTGEEYFRVPIWVDFTEKDLGIFEKQTFIAREGRYPIVSVEERYANIIWDAETERNTADYSRSIVEDNLDSYIKNASKIKNFALWTLGAFALLRVSEESTQTLNLNPNPALVIIAKTTHLPVKANLHLPLVSVLRIVRVGDLKEEKNIIFKPYLIDRVGRVIDDVNIECMVITNSQTNPIQEVNTMGERYVARIPSDATMAALMCWVNNSDEKLAEMLSERYLDTYQVWLVHELYADEEDKLPSIYIFSGPIYLYSRNVSLPQPCVLESFGIDPKSGNFTVHIKINNVIGGMLNIPDSDLDKSSENLRMVCALGGIVIDSNGNYVPIVFNIEGTYAPPFYSFIDALFYPGTGTWEVRISG